MDVYFPVLILLGITAGPLCPLGCVGGIWKPQIRRIREVVQPGSSDHRLGGWSCCAVGKLQSQGCCSEEHLPREKPHMGSLCALRVAPVLSMEGKCELSSTDPGWYLHGKMMSLVTDGRLLTAEITFQEVSVEILSFCLENVGSLQITERSEKSNSVNNTLEMRKS